MPKFFSDLNKYKMLEEWTEILDWLLDDSRFSNERGWNKNTKDRFTNKAKKVENLQKENWIYNTQKLMKWNVVQPSKPFVQMQKGSGQGEDLIKHIRNGIAHGQTSIRKKQGELWLEIKDYNDNLKQKQTAYLWIPMKYLGYWKNIYKEIEQAERSDATKSGRTKRKVS